MERGCSEAGDRKVRQRHDQRGTPGLCPAGSV